MFLQTVEYDFARWARGHEPPNPLNPPVNSEYKLDKNICGQNKDRLRFITAQQGCIIAKLRVTCQCICIIYTVYCKELQELFALVYVVSFLGETKTGPVRDLNPGPLAPKARIIPLDQRAVVVLRQEFLLLCIGVRVGVLTIMFSQRV